MQEELVFDHRMAGKDDQTISFDRGGVGIGRVGGADDLNPMVPDSLLGRGATDVVLRHQLLDHGCQILGRTLDRAAGFLGRQPATQRPDKLLGEFAELGRLVRHGVSGKQFKRCERNFNKGVADGESLGPTSEQPARRSGPTI